jgi:mannose-6-phosphate isomerase-like protein (cupin superfamily)
MLKKLLLTLPTLALYAAAPSGFNEWTASDLKAKAAQLKGAMKNGLGSETVANWGTHQMVVIHREKSGQSELHEKQADVIVVRRGSGTVVIGGTIVGGKTTAPGEIRGESIEGGELHELKEGSILHVPPQTAHQVILKAGQTIDYLAIKADGK